MDGLQLHRPDCQTVGFVSSLLISPDYFSNCPVVVVLDPLFFICGEARGQDLDKINLLVCMYVIYCTDAVVTHVGTPDDRIQKLHTYPLLPVSCGRGVPTASKRCYYIKYLPMAHLLANYSSRSFIFFYVYNLSTLTSEKAYWCTLTCQLKPHSLSIIQTIN